MVASETLDRDVRLFVYRRFVELGEPPTVAQTAEALGCEREEAEAAFRRLEAARVLVLAPGTADIWMANPLSAIPTPFEVRTADARHYFGNCIWDALGVLAMLHTDGTVMTFCPDCNDVLTVRIEDGRARDGDGVVHYAVPAAHWWDDIGST